MVVGDAMAAAVADALDLELNFGEAETVPAQYLEPYSSPRWAPVT